MLCSSGFLDLALIDSQTFEKDPLLTTKRINVDILYSKGRGLN
jgi:hypothetical protein